MNENKAVKDRDKGIFIVPQQEEFKTVQDLTQIEPVTKSGRGDDCVKKKAWCASIKLNILHNLTLSIVGFISWGLLWCAFGDDWRWDGQWFRLAAVAVVAWASGQILEKLTTLPPLLGALLIGIFARYFGVLDMRHYHQVDSFLRKIYPVIILGKGSLAWDVNYMKNNWKQVAALGTLPWAVEVAITALCTHYLLAFPWVWGLLLGSIYASVSFAVVMPLVQRHGAGPERSRNWPQLICTAGGIDTALSVGVYGLIHSFIFTNTIDVYRYTKAALTLFAGVALGVIWGSLAKFVPHSSDFYVTELRVMFVLVGGLFANFFTSAIGWGGTGGVAVLVCNATAATHWAQNGWKLNKNPASTVYKLLWSVLEPMLFAYTGTFFVMHNNMVHTMYVGLAILVITLTARLITTTLVCWNFSIKEKLFVCCTWISKSIVEAVLCPLAIITLMSNTSSNEHDIRYAEDLMRLIIQAILITTPIGFLLTNFLAPIFLSRKSSSQDTESQQRKSRD